MGVEFFFGDLALNWAIRIIVFFLLTLGVVACVQEIPREPDTPPAAAVNPPFPRPVAAATRTATPTPSELDNPGPPPTSTATPTASPTPSPTATATATPQPTFTPSPTATATAVPDTPTPTPEPAADLLLDVRGPANGATVQSDGVVVHGFASLGTTVTVNGKIVELEENGRFQTVVTLSPGANEIEVIATDGDSGLEKRTTLTVNSQVLPPQPFFLLVTQPHDQSIVPQRQIPVAGRTIPGAVVSVNGVSVAVDTVGIYSTMIRLEPGPNIIDVVATNVDGEVLSTIIAVIYRP
jgi:hypothetical protein